MEPYRRFLAACAALGLVGTAGLAGSWHVVVTSTGRAAAQDRLTAAQDRLTAGGTGQLVYDVTLVPRARERRTRHFWDAAAPVDHEQSSSATDT